MALEEDQGVMEELDKLVSMEDLKEDHKRISDRRKGRKKAGMKELEKNKWIADVVDETISDGYIYSGAERQTQQAEAWRRYFRQEYGNETDGYSTYVSDLLQSKVNQTRAFITEQYYRNSSPILKFSPSSHEDAEEAQLATEYTNYVFRNKLDGHSIIDQTVFNAALLKICPVRVYLKEKRSNEVVDFKYEGKKEDLEDALASFLVANEDVTGEEPYEAVEEELEDGKMYACYKWHRKDIVERYPEVEVISPENFFISRQAESLESAKVVAKITNMRLGDIMEMFPDAPAMNGFAKKDYQEFWEQLQSDYQTWYSETTWFAKWSYDSLQFFEQYDNQNDESAGLGTKDLFVVDAEIYLDPDDTGVAKLCHVVKAGNNILFKEEISERSFLCSSLIPTANRWIGIGLWDLLEQEMREETNLARAMTDAAAQAAHPNITFDPGVYESDDVYNRGPDTVIRVVEGAIPQQGVNPIDVLKLPGPDPTVQATLEYFRARADDNSGVGMGIQGASAAEISDMRMDKAAAQAQMTQSTQFLNFMARNYADFLSSVLVKILDVAIKGGASSKLMEIKDSWMKIEPVGMKPRVDFVLDVDIGVNEAQEKMAKAQAIMQAVSVLTGQPDPQTGETLGVQAELLPTAGYELGKLLLEAHGGKDIVDKVFVRPEVAEDPQVQAAIQGAVAQAQQEAQMQMAQMEEQIRQQVTMELQVQEKQQANALKEREVGIKERELELKEDSGAFDAATKDVAEERRSEEDAYKMAIEERKLDQKDRELDLKDKELDILKQVKTESTDKKTTGVVSP